MKYFFGLVTNLYLVIYILLIYLINIMKIIKH